MKDLVWRIWWHWLKWPMPLWRLRGRGTVQLAGTPTVLTGLRRSHHLAWAQGIRLGLDEPEVISYLARAVQPDDTVLDVGAYVGGFTIIAARRGRHVYAFEPDATNREMLRRNLEANRITNATIIDAAVSDHVGTVRFESSGRTTSRVAAGDGGTPATTLDAFCAEHGVQPAVIKMDIEGGEAAALSESASARALDAARVVVVEIHEFAGVDYHQIAARFEGQGKHATDMGGRSGANYNVAFT